MRNIERPAKSACKAQSVNDLEFSGLAVFPRLLGSNLCVADRFQLGYPCGGIMIGRINAQTVYVAEQRPHESLDAARQLSSPRARARLGGQWPIAEAVHRNIVPSKTPQPNNTAPESSPIPTHR
jgi:hypothetical protein